MRSALLALSFVMAYAAIGAACFFQGRLYEQQVLEAERRQVIAQLEVLATAIEAVAEQEYEEPQERSILVQPICPQPELSIDEAI